jgi:hypothetical protein
VRDIVGSRATVTYKQAIRVSLLQQIGQGSLGEFGYTNKVIEVDDLSGTCTLLKDGPGDGLRTRDVQLGNLQVD